VADRLADSSILRFGIFEVDLRNFELRRKGLKVKVQEKPFRVLTLLLQRPGQIVTRQELRKELWPANTFVGFDDGLNAAVKKLRIALGDSGENPRFVETVPRHGYRFIAPLERTAEALPSVSMPLEYSASFLKHAEAQPESGCFRSQPLRAVVPLILALVCSAVLIMNFADPRLREGNIIFPKSTNTVPRFRSIAVLPLEELSGNARQEYFSDGITDELITNLAQLRNVRVISRISSMRYKHTDKPLRQIGLELGVGALVEGTIQRIGNRVKIRVQLIDCGNDSHLWAQSCDRELSDILVTEEEVATSIADAIEVRLMPGGQDITAHARTVQPAAQDAYFRARYFLASRREQDYKKALKHFKLASELDPSDARALAGMADSYLLLGGYGLMPQREAVQEAKLAAQKAIALDPALSDAHVVLGKIAENYDWQWTVSDHEYARAIELRPSNSIAHHWYAEYLISMGRVSDAISEIKQAEQLDPLSPIVYADAGKIFWFARQYDLAVMEDKHALEIDPHFSLASDFLSLALLSQGHTNGAIAQVQRASRWDDTPLSLSILGYCYAVAGRKEEAQEVLYRLRELSTTRFVDPSFLGRIYIALGDRNSAFASLEREYQAHSANLNRLLVSPIYDPLRSDPRFNDLVSRMGLPQSHTNSNAQQIGSYRTTKEGRGVQQTAHYSSRVAGRWKAQQ
jgi:TolB-like protein/DNA-binding winged helix-turn-helix (wHTH) protein/Flp pilus assembly protein TadD